MSMSIQSIDALAVHAEAWTRLMAAKKTGRIPSALLLLGPRAVALGTLAHRWVAALFCAEGCGTCSACVWLMENRHPDLYRIQPEEGHAIKIDAIRALQEWTQVSPVCQDKRFVMIESAHKMNQAAANALLKLLEEPPTSIHFILIAEQVCTLPATIISRCQCLQVKPNVTGAAHLANLQADTPARQQLLQAVDDIIMQWCDVLEYKQTVCQVASIWNAYTLEDLCWLLYAIIADTLVGQLSLRVMSHVSPRWLALTKPSWLYQRLDYLVALQRRLHTQTVNSVLAIESLLGYEPI